MSSNSSVEVVTLNVGGTIYTTARSTLTQFGDTMLGAMLSGRHHTLSKDKNGNLFIDRDGPMFRHVLNFLRTGRLTLPGDFKDHDMLEAEADFFGIDQLVDAVRAARVPVVTESPKASGTGFKRDPGTLLEIYQVKCDVEPQFGGYVALYGARWALLSLPLNTAATQQLHSNATSFQTVYVDEKVKMDLFAHLQVAGWKLISTSFSIAYSPVIDKYDHAKCYTCHKYMWSLEEDPSKS